MNSLRGCSVLTFECGTLLRGEVNVASLRPSTSGWTGKFNSKVPVRKDIPSEMATLLVGGQNFRVQVALTEMDGILQFEATSLRT